MLLSVDHGNYAIKTPFFSFVSGLSEHTSCPPLADELLEYDGRFWTLSGKRISYMRAKTQDDRFFILTLFAIVRELVRTGSCSPLSQIDLAVGPPSEYYGVLKDRFANCFGRKDPVRFVCHDRPYMIAINSAVLSGQDTIEFDKDCGDQDCENARRADPRTHDLKLLWQKVPFITKKVPSKTTY